MSRRHAALNADAVATIAETAAYRELIDRLKQRVRESQARAARKVNAELVMLYWSIGREILVQQQAQGWGDGVVERISQDLTVEVGGARGFSRRSLFYMRRFAALWPDREKCHHWRHKSAGPSIGCCSIRSATSPTCICGTRPKLRSTDGRDDISKLKSVCACTSVREQR